jgi:hypothetical protein
MARDGVGGIFKGDPAVFKPAEVALQGAHQQLLRLAATDAKVTPGLFVSAESLLRTYADARMAEPHVDVEEKSIAELRGLVRLLSKYNKEPSDANARLVLDGMDQSAKSRQFEANSVADAVAKLGSKLASLHPKLGWAEKEALPGLNPQPTPEVQRFMKEMKSTPGRASYYPPQPKTPSGIKT